VSFNEMTLSDHVRANGMSVVDPARMQRAIAAVEEAYGMAARLKVEDMYTDAYLPPVAQRRIVPQA
jgi:NitT/TauT family transport system substrate-binding protein